MTSPGSVAVQGVGSAGVGLCQAETADLPLFCEAAPGAIGGAGAGAATFDSATSGVGWAGFTRALTINIEYNFEAPCLQATLVCGFSAVICNDRDLDAVCTNVGDHDDELATAYSNEPATDVDCGDGKKDDEKDCSDNDGTTLGKTVCVRRTAFAGAGTLTDPDDPGGWNNADQIVVFVGAWAGKVTEDPSDANLGAGLSAGTYDVGLTDNGSADCDTVAVTPSSGCIWEANPAGPLPFPDGPGGHGGDGPIETVVQLTTAPPTVPYDVEDDSSGLTGSGTCEDDGGNQSFFSCHGGSAVIAFVIGVGASTATETWGNCLNDSSAITAVFPGLAVSGDSVGPSGGWFTCDFTWTGIAVGGCITV